MAIDLERAEVAPGLYRLGHPLVNWYLLSTDEGVTIFDAGAPAHWPQVEEALTALGKGFGDVRALVLTHPDMDHIGFAETLRAQHGVRVLIHDEDSPQARGEAKKKGERSLLAYLWRPAALSTVAYFARSGRPKPVGEVETFADGDTLDVPGRPRAVHTPGHTVGHCVLHLADQDAVITGDALVTLDPLTGRKGPRLIGRALNADTAQATRSLDRIGELDAGTLLPGHGDPWRGGTKAGADTARVEGAA